MTTPTDPRAKGKAPNRADSPPNRAAADLQSAFGPNAMDPHEGIHDGRDGRRAVDDAAPVDTAPERGDPSRAHPVRDPLAMNPGTRASSDRRTEPRDAAKAKPAGLAGSKDPGVVEEDDGIIDF